MKLIFAALSTRARLAGLAGAQGGVVGLGGLQRLGQREGLGYLWQLAGLLRPRGPAGQQQPRQQQAPAG
jgi:hypothetical protein